MDTGLRPPGMEVMLGMQEQFPVRRGDETIYFVFVHPVTTGGFTVVGVNGGLRLCQSVAFS
jgi:hypothetical protein